MHKSDFSTFNLLYIMQTQWSQIIDYFKKNDRISFDSLNPGASSEEIENLEKNLDKTLTDSFKGFYQIHNGWNELVWPRATSLLSIQEILEEWKSLNNLYSDYLEDEYEGDPHSQEVKKLKWDKKWIPFAKSSRGRDFYCLDFDPSKTGTEGQIIFLSTDLGDREFIAKTFEEWINDYIVELTKNSKI